MLGERYFKSNYNNKIGSTKAIWADMEQVKQKWNSAGTVIQEGYTRNNSKQKATSLDPDDVSTVKRGLSYLWNESGGLVIVINSLARNVADSIPALRLMILRKICFFFVIVSATFVIGTTVRSLWSLYHYRIWSLVVSLGQHLCQGNTWCLFVQFDIREMNRSKKEWEWMTAVHAYLCIYI